MIHTEQKLNSSLLENYLRYILAIACFALSLLTYAQDDQPLSIDNIEIPDLRLPGMCTGVLIGQEVITISIPFNCC